MVVVVAGSPPPPPEAVSLGGCVVVLGFALGVVDGLAVDVVDDAAGGGASHEVSALGEVDGGGASELGGGATEDVVGASVVGGGSELAGSEASDAGAEELVDVQFSAVDAVHSAPAAPVHTTTPMTPTLSVSPPAAPSALIDRRSRRTYISPLGSRSPFVCPCAGPGTP